ncbi:MAG: hypothetical protein QM765_30390 [Myxococcales bacterium]
MASRSPHRVDPTLFEPAMPDAVRSLIAEAREGRGTLASWFAGREVKQAFALLHATPPVDPVVLGWVLGITAFSGRKRSFLDALRSCTAPVLSAAIDAFSAGVLAGVPVFDPMLWKDIELLREVARDGSRQPVPGAPRGARERCWRGARHRQAARASHRWPRARLHR